MSFLKKVQNDGLIIQLKELLTDYPELNYFNMDKTSYPSYKISKGNYKCSGCDKGSTEITTAGHQRGCKWVSIKKQFDSVFSKLSKYEKENFELIIQELNY